jgi:hypothetical protein
MERDGLMAYQSDSNPFNALFDARESADANSFATLMLGTNEHFGLMADCDQQLRLQAVQVRVASLVKTVHSENKPQLSTGHSIVA